MHLGPAFVLAAKITTSGSRVLGLESQLSRVSCHQAPRSPRGKVMVLFSHKNHRTQAGEGCPFTGGNLYAYIVLEKGVDRRVVAVSMPISRPSNQVTG